MTWRQFDEAVNSAARGLIQLGFKRGDHFGVWATNWPEWVLLQFATARIGVVLATINPVYRPSELAYTLEHSQIRGLAMIDHFKSTDFDELFCELCPEIETAHEIPFQCYRFPKRETIVRLRETPRGDMLTWNELCDLGAKVTDQAWQTAKRTPVASDPINLQYTSGTTGHPKGALLTHRNILLNAFYGGECQKLSERDRICIPVPLYHCFGCVLGTLTVRYMAQRWCLLMKVFARRKRLKPSGVRQFTAYPRCLSRC